MTITINTSDYIKAKSVEINGEKLKFFPITTAQYAKYLTLTEQAQALDKSDPSAVKAAAGLVDDFLELVCGLFDKPKRAKELLSPIPLPNLKEIIEALMSEEETNG